LGLSSTAFTLLRECLPAGAFNHATALAQGIKALPITLQSTRPLDEAISSAGGVAWDALGSDYQLNALPSVFCAGEMLDWEAPTGGYLLTACWATGRAAGAGAAAYAAKHSLA
jgi:predicted flavoprotein YhiN